MSDNDPGSSGIASGRRRRADAATALALGEAGRDPSAAPEAAAFLREQLALTKLQVEHFEAEHRHTVDGTRASRALEAMKIIMQGAFKFAAARTMDSNTGDRAMLDRVARATARA